MREKRHAMHLLTNSKAALREAVLPDIRRLSPCEIEQETGLNSFEKKPATVDLHAGVRKNQNQQKKS